MIGYIVGINLAVNKKRIGGAKKAAYALAFVEGR
jgi:hypothetical protein